MDHAVAERIEAFCDELGLDHSVARRLTADVLVPELETCRRQLRQLSDENQKLRQTQQEIIQLIGCRKPDKLLHDLRNVLNELALLKAVADQE